METIGEKIRRLRKSLNLTQKEVADSIGIKASSVTQWENDVTKPSGQNLLELASILQTPPQYLVGGPSSVIEQRAEHRVDRKIIKLRRIPIISSVQAGSWSEVVENFHPGEAAYWQETTANVSVKSFALRVEGKSMHNPSGSPSIPNGSIVIVDPEVAATNGKIVVAKLPYSEEAVIKKLVIDGSNRYLESLNPDYKPILIDSECIIVGVVRQVIQDI